MLEHRKSPRRDVERLASDLRALAGIVSCPAAARRLLPHASGPQLLSFANGLLPAPARPQPGRAPEPHITELLQVQAPCPVVGQDQAWHLCTSAQGDAVLHSSEPAGAWVLHSLSAVRVQHARLSARASHVQKPV